MSKNTELWDRVCTTDPSQVKKITGKQYTGNSPKPYWIVQRLTEEFGPCGIGWGFSIVGERIERFGETDSLHIATVRLWYVLDGTRGEVEQIGQTKCSYVSGQGKFILDEDAPKKSVTDALVKCASYIGFAGDIFSGRWDDSKYVAEAKRHYEEKGSAEEGAGDWVNEWVDYIQGAANADDLKTRLEEAIAVAKEANDKAAAQQFRKVAEELNKEFKQ